MTSALQNQGIHNHSNPFHHSSDLTPSAVQDILHSHNGNFSSLPEQVIQAFKNSGNQIIELQLSGIPFQPGDIRELVKYFPNLVSLSFFPKTDHDSYYRKFLNDLFVDKTHIDLYNFINDQVLMEISKLIKLEQLHLGHSCLTKEGFSLLGQMNSLKSLSLINCEHTDNEVDEICKLYNLEGLFLAGSYGTTSEGSINHFKKLKNLKELIYWHGTSLDHREFSETIKNLFTTWPGMTTKIGECEAHYFYRLEANRN